MVLQDALAWSADKSGSPVLSVINLANQIVGWVDRRETQRHLTLKLGFVPQPNLQALCQNLFIIIDEILLSLQVRESPTYERNLV